MNKEFRDGSLILVEKTTYLDNGKNWSGLGKWTRCYGQKSENQ
ncbi:hypothetical protein RCO48_30600 [Peribacillus frigoritolerans]|nr:hypothetical protein [Peribacillus frigoritolerans]